MVIVVARGACSGCKKPIGDNKDYVICSKCGAMMHRLAKCMVCKGDKRYCPSCGAYVYTR